MFEKVFRTYDIRGEADLFNKEFLKKFAKALAYFIQERGYNELIIGKDKRESSDFIFNNLIKELSKYLNVYYIRVSTTPLVRFISNEYKIFGINITASHLEDNYNGFKLFYEDGEDFKPEDIRKLKDYFIENKEPDKINGTILDLNEIDDYLSNYFKTIKRKIKKVYMDEVNVAIGKNYEVLFKLIENYFDVKVNLIKSEKILDPNDPERIKDILKILKYGFIVDGDVDRLSIVIDNTRVPAYKIYLALIERLKIKKATFEITLPYWYLENFVKVIPSKTGRVFIVENMIKDNTIEFGGEYSNHFISKKYSPTKGKVYSDDGLVNLLLIMKYFRDFEELKESLNKFETIKSKLINIKVENKIEFINKIKSKLNNFEINYPLEDNKNVFEIKYLDGRILVRPSDTEDKIRILLESKGNIEKLEKIILPLLNL